MSLWTWVLVGLCVAGIGLAIGAMVPVLAEALKLRAHMKNLRSSSLFVSLQSMQLQAARLNALAKKMQALANRAQAATASIQASKQLSGLEDAQQSLRAAGADIHELVNDLR